MFRAIMDLISAIVILGFTYFAGSEAIEFFRKETVQHVQKGLSPTYKFTKALTGKSFDWENN